MSDPDEAADQAPLVLVRYGLAREIQLFPDALVFVSREENDEDRFPLSDIRQIIMQPGERIPSKLLLLLELADGPPIIVAEGMTNVRDFRQILARLPELAPHITLDPADMDAQLAQAVRNRRQTNLGCYSVFLTVFVLIALICVIGNLLIRH